MRSPHNTLRFFAGLVLGAVGCLLVLEIALRFLPVYSGIRMTSGGGEQAFMHKLPHQPYVYSYGWNLANANRGMVNALGFTNSPDSMAPGGVIVVGDSYIEALMLDFPDTLQGRLARMMPGQVLALGTSGYGLADYLPLLETYASKFHPATVVIFIGGRDLDELLVKPLPGYNYFWLDDGVVKTRQIPYIESPLKEKVMQSALVRYLFYNLKVSLWINQLTGRFSVVKPALKADLQTNKELKQRYLDYFFDRLQQIAGQYRFKPVFLLDGDRKNIYLGRLETEKSKLDEVEADRRLFLGYARRANMSAIDMEPLFNRHWQVNRERLDWLPMDGHWNPAAHKLAAEAIIQALKEP